jgi:hypothetical protein
VSRLMDRIKTSTDQVRCDGVAAPTDDILQMCTGSRVDEDDPIRSDRNMRRG